MGSSAWTRAWRPSAGLQVGALDCVASRWLFARGCALFAGLVLGAGWTGESLGSGICAQQSFLLFSFLPLVFLLPFSRNKAKEEEKVKRASPA